MQFGSRECHAAACARVKSELITQRFEVNRYIQALAVQREKARAAWVSHATGILAIKPSIARKVPPG
jgi:hypothetical protein